MERAIEERIAALSPGGFQRLAEWYAELVWPNRYHHLIPQGRNADDATTAGWPDAWSMDSDGRVHAVEATRATAWETHLAADVEKAKQLEAGVLGSFVFVSRMSQPDDEKLKTYRTALRGLGLQGADIDFVFMPRLRRDLAKPRFARARALLLGLPPTSAPLVSIDRARRLYGDGSREAFVPTREEFASGAVHRAQAVDVIEGRLRHSGWALVRGRGASGKSVIAAQVGRAWAAGPDAAWYADMAQLSDDGLRSLSDQMTVLGDDGVLFIVDNVHTNEELGGELFDYWESRGDGSRLLVLGRLVCAGPGKDAAIRSPTSMRRAS